MNFNLEEKIKIRKAYRTVMKDLESVLQTSKCGSICITFDEVIKEFDNVLNSNYNAKYVIEANSKEVRLLATWRYTGGTRDIVSLAQINSFKKVKPLFLSYDICATFVRLYPEIRKKLIEKIKIENEIKVKNDNKERQSKEKTLRELEIVQNRYSTPADIEIDLPPSQNKHKLVVTKENGRNIGTLDFGGSTIRLITDGKIMLVDGKETSTNVLKKKR